MTSSSKDFLLQDERRWDHGEISQEKNLEFAPQKSQFTELADEMALQLDSRNYSKQRKKRYLNKSREQHRTE